MTFTKWFWRSTWIDTIDRGEGKVEIRRSSTYVRPKRDGEIKGKLNLKHTKRQKVRAMKAAGHVKGDNRPFVS